jgi:hypothetical protein
LVSWCVNVVCVCVCVCVTVVSAIAPCVRLSGGSRNENDGCRLEVWVDCGMENENESTWSLTAAFAPALAPAVAHNPVVLARLVVRAIADQQDLVLSSCWVGWIERFEIERVKARHTGGLLLTHSTDSKSRPETVKTHPTTTPTQPTQALLQHRHARTAWLRSAPQSSNSSTPEW